MGFSGRFNQCLSHPFLQKTSVAYLWKMLFKKKKEEEGVKVTEVSGGGHSLRKGEQERGGDLASEVTGEVILGSKHTFPGSYWMLSHLIYLSRSES